MEEQNLTNALRPGPECPSIERLGRYADGALTPEERRREESHIATCANCQAELALLHAFATPAVRDDEAEVVRWGVEQLRRREPEIFDGGRLKDSSVRRWLSIGRLRPALALAVVLLALVGGYYLDQSSGAPASDRHRFEPGSDALAERHGARADRRSDERCPPGCSGSRSAARRGTASG